MTGISHVIPLIVAGGMIAAICVIFARTFGFTDLMNTEGSWLYLIKSMGSGLLGTLMVPVLSAYMAYSIDAWWDHCWVFNTLFKEMDSS